MALKFIDEVNERTFNQIGLKMRLVKKKWCTSWIEISYIQSVNTQQQDSYEIELET